MKPSRCIASSMAQTVYIPQFPFLSLNLSSMWTLNLSCMQGSHRFAYIKFGYFFLLKIKERKHWYQTFLTAKIFSTTRKTNSVTKVGIPSRVRSLYFSTSISATFLSSDTGFPSATLITAKWAQSMCDKMPNLSLLEGPVLLTFHFLNQPFDSKWFAVQLNS